MSTRKLVLALCAAAIFAIVVAPSPAGKKHKHQTIQKYASAPVSTGAGQINSGIVFCPPGSIATGGGEDFVAGIATIDMGFVGVDAYYVLVDNFNGGVPSRVDVQVACTAGTTKAKGREMSRAHARNVVEEMEAEREAAYAAAK
jgi:predicted secreted protein